MINEIKKLLKDNSVSAIICGIISVIWLMPIAILFVIAYFLIEKPILYIIEKFKSKKTKAKAKPKRKARKKKK